MCSLESGAQADAPAGGAQAPAELDVLDRRVLVALDVESADREKSAAPPDAATGPERRCLFGPFLMIEVVHEVLVLGQKVACGRGVVVGAEDGDHAGIAESLSNDPGGLGVG